MRYVKISDARKELPQLVESAQDSIITRNGEPVCVLVGFEHYRALRAAAALAKDPERLKQLLEAHERIQGGDREGLVSLEDVKARLEEANTVRG